MALWRESPFKELNDSQELGGAMTLFPHVASRNSSDNRLGATGMPCGRVAASSLVLVLGSLYALHCATIFKGDTNRQRGWGLAMCMEVNILCVWVKITSPGDRRCSSLFPFTRVPFWVPIFDPRPHGPIA